MESADVIHSFWIPDMGQKQDLVPGIKTSIIVTPTRTGVFSLVCTELCGVGHATMRATVRVVSQGVRGVGEGAERRRRRQTGTRPLLSSRRRLRGPL